MLFSKLGIYWTFVQFQLGKVNLRDVNRPLLFCDAGVIFSGGFIKFLGQLVINCNFFRNQLNWRILFFRNNLAMTKRLFILSYIRYIWFLLLWNRSRWHLQWRFFIFSQCLLLIFIALWRFQFLRIFVFLFVILLLSKFTFFGLTFCNLFLL